MTIYYNTTKFKAYLYNDEIVISSIYQPNRNSNLIEICFDSSVNITNEQGNPGEDYIKLVINEMAVCNTAAEPLANPTQTMKLDIIGTKTLILPNNELIADLDTDKIPYIKNITVIDNNKITVEFNVEVQPNEQTVYVSATGAGDQDGTSQSNAYGEFDKALGDITSWGSKLIIIGTVSASGANLTTKRFAFTIEGLDDSSTLSGGNNPGRLFTINGATTANVTLKNLTFSGYNTTLTGGVFFNNNAGATVTFNNCNLTGNTVTNTQGGGAIWFSHGALNIIDSSFENNTSSDRGGAIFANSGTITITNTLFKKNSAATRGGAIYTTNGDFTITGSTFYDNETTGAGGGSAFYVASSDSTNSITNCTFFENTTANGNQDYGTIRTDNGNTTVTNSLFYDNKTNNDAGEPSDWGSNGNGTDTFKNSIAQWISNNIHIQDEGTGSITGIKGGTGTPANLASSNLVFNATSGYVEYNTVEEGTDSPIDFGSDGNDVGAWNSRLTLTVEDNTAPVITVTPGTDTVEQGSTWTDAGATSDGGETVTVSGIVNETTAGTYTITYTATDASGNDGTATRTVTVEDTTAPVITLIGESTVTIEQGSTYTDAGATANTGETVTALGSVDTSVVDTYTITYTAKDASGNIGTATRTVNVVFTINNPLLSKMNKDIRDLKSANSSLKRELATIIKNNV